MSQVALLESIPSRPHPLIEEPTAEWTENNFYDTEHIQILGTPCILVFVFTKKSPNVTLWTKWSPFDDQVVGVLRDLAEIGIPFIQQEWVDDVVPV